MLEDLTLDRLRPILQPFSDSLIILVLFGVAALLVDRWVFGALRHLTSHTKSRLDDVLIEHLHRPSAWSVFLIGAWYATTPLHASDHSEYVIEGLFAKRKGGFAEQYFYAGPAEDY